MRGVCQRATGAQTERAPVAKVQNKVMWDYNPKYKAMFESILIISD